MAAVIEVPQDVLAVTIELYALPQLPERLSLTQRQGVYQYILRTRNPVPFIQDLRNRLPFTPALSERQLLAVARIMVQGFTRILRDNHLMVEYSAEGVARLVGDPDAAVSVAEMSDAPVQPRGGLGERVRQATLPVRQLLGTYAVQLPGEEDQVTLRIKAVEGKYYRDRAVVGKLCYLAGPDNEVDYIAFGWLLEGGVYVLWQRFAQDGRLSRAARVVLEAGEEAHREQGGAYARRSGNCYRCGRTLTVVSSIDAGLGPVCATKV